MQLSPNLEFSLESSLLTPRVTGNLGFKLRFIDKGNLLRIRVRYLKVVVWLF